MVTFEPILAPVFWRTTAVGVAEDQYEQVGLIEVVLNGRRVEQVVNIGGNLRPFDVDLEFAGGLLHGGHRSGSLSAAGFESLSEVGHEDSAA